MILNMKLIPYDGDEMPVLREAGQLEATVSELIIHINETRAKDGEIRSVLNNAQHWDKFPDAHVRNLHKSFYHCAWLSAYVGSKLSSLRAVKRRKDLMVKLGAIHAAVTSGEFGRQPSLVNTAKNNHVVLREFMKFTSARVYTPVVLDDGVGLYPRLLAEQIDALRGDSFSWYKVVTADFGYSTFPPDKFFVVPRSLIFAENEILAFHQPLVVLLDELEAAIVSARGVLMKAYEWDCPHTLGEQNEKQYLKNYERARTEKDRRSLKAKQNDKRCGVIRIRIGAEQAVRACLAAAERIEAVVNRIADVLPRNIVADFYAGEVRGAAIVCNCVGGMAWARELELYAAKLREFHETAASADEDNVCQATLDALFNGEESLPDDLASGR